MTRVVDSDRIADAFPGPVMVEVRDPRVRVAFLTGADADAWLDAAPEPPPDPRSVGAFGMPPRSWVTVYPLTTPEAAHAALTDAYEPCPGCGVPWFTHTCVARP